MEEALRLPVRSRLDADQARRAARHLATELGFSRLDAESVALAVSELAMNLHRYARDGEMVLQAVQDGARRGIEIVSIDAGPGIADLDLALQDGYTTGGGLGSGLPSARRLMDEFELTTTSSGTRIMARKWLSTQSPSA